LIRTGVWSYSSNVIIGPTLFDIPLEELFFFVIQTYNTSLLYLFLSKATFHPIYLRPERKKSDVKGPINEKLRYYKIGGQLLITGSIVWSFHLVRSGGEGTYLGLIIAWAFPFLLLLWSLAYQFLIGLPWTNTILPIILPTLYLWVVDTFALQRGTWFVSSIVGLLHVLYTDNIFRVIENGTKFGIHIWPALEIEEAVFFLVTNCLIVFGLVAFDNALAILDGLTPLLLIKTLLKPAADYDEERIHGLKDAVHRLQQKSRSFFLASGAFEGKLRIGLINLYSFCRVADDLVDEADSIDESRQWIKKLEQYLNLSYEPKTSNKRLQKFIVDEFPARAHFALQLLPVQLLDKEPLYELLRGFEMDLKFSNAVTPLDFPIRNTQDLDLYGVRVAGTVASLCLDLVFAYTPHDLSLVERQKIVQAGSDMGKALQFVNISRDIAVDAELNRVYIPTEWLADESLTPQEVISNPNGDRIDTLRQKLLDRAFAAYKRSRATIDRVPQQAGPLRVCVESYMEIGRVLRVGGYSIVKGRATVPKFKRIVVAWKAMSSSGCSS